MASAESPCPAAPTGTAGTGLGAAGKAASRAARACHGAGGPAAASAPVEHAESINNPLTQTPCNISFHSQTGTNTLKDYGSILSQKLSSDKAVEDYKTKCARLQTMQGLGSSVS